MNSTWLALFNFRWWQRERGERRENERTREREREKERERERGERERERERYVSLSSVWIYRNKSSAVTISRSTRLGAVKHDLHEVTDWKKRNHAILLQSWLCVVENKASIHNHCSTLCTARHRRAVVSGKKAAVYIPHVARVCVYGAVYRVALLQSVSSCLMQPGGGGPIALRPVKISWKYVKNARHCLSLITFQLFSCRCPVCPASTLAAPCRMHQAFFKSKNFRWLFWWTSIYFAVPHTWKSFGYDHFGNINGWINIFSSRKFVAFNKSIWKILPDISIKE